MPLSTCSFDHFTLSYTQTVPNKNVCRDFFDFKKLILDALKLCPVDNVPGNSLRRQSFDGDDCGSWHSAIRVSISEEKGSIVAMQFAAFAARADGSGDEGSRRVIFRRVIHPHPTRTRSLVPSLLLQQFPLKQHSFFRLIFVDRKKWTNSWILALDSKLPLLLFSNVS